MTTLTQATPTTRYGLLNPDERKSLASQIFTDNMGDPLEIYSPDPSTISVIVTERTRGRGPAEACFDPADAVRVAHAILDAANAPRPAAIQDDAVEFVLHLANGSRFYTGGFDDAATIWRLVNDGISGTFDGDAPAEREWNVVEFDRGAVIAIEDLRLS